MGDLQVLLFLVLMMGVGLGSAAAAWVLRPTKEERQAWSYWQDSMTPGTTAAGWASASVTTGSGEPPATS